MLAESAGIAATMGDHWAELGLTASTVYLGYVTQLPYAVRRRLHGHVRRITVIVITRVGHHIRAVRWQITYFMPGRVRQPWWNRNETEE